MKTRCKTPRARGTKPAPTALANKEDVRLSFVVDAPQADYLDGLAEEIHELTPGSRAPNRTAALRWLINYAISNRVKVLVEAA